MKTSANSTVKVLATGFIVLLLFAIVAFYGRFVIDVRLVAGLSEDATRVVIQPSGLLPDVAEREPNLSRPSSAGGRFNPEAILGSLGLVDYLTSLAPGGARSAVFYYEDRDEWMYFDRASGQIVRRRTDAQARRIITYYAGPEGVSDMPEAGHGHFLDPMVALGAGEHFVYDRGLRRFFSIDWGAPQVRMGPAVEGSPRVEPVRFGRNLTMEMAGVRVSWTAPMTFVRRDAEQEGGRPQYESQFTMEFGLGDPNGYLPVVDASGRLDLLNGQTLELIRGRGFLPTPQTLYGQGSHRPSRLLGYDVELVGVGRDPEYIGLVAGSLSRQGMSIALSVHDESGRQVRRSGSVMESLSVTGSPRQLRSENFALFGVPWGPALTISKYLIESMHPPVLTLASYFTANEIEARASHRALFLLPNSFVAMHRDRVEQDVFSQLAGVLWTMLPALLLAGFLAWRVGRDAVMVGLPGGARIAWIVATLAFALPAYITYRLTRPKEALVTCANCGQVRRPEHERCHRCNSPWRVAELVPPAWRVLDEGPASLPDVEESEEPVSDAEQNSDSSVESM